MSNASPVSMQELQMESADLLPGRETLCVSSYHSYGGGEEYVGSAFTQLGYGNTAQSGLLNVALLNGSLDNLINL